MKNPDKDQDFMTSGQFCTVFLKMKKKCFFSGKFYSISLSSKSEKSFLENETNVEWLDPDPTWLCPWNRLADSPGMPPVPDPAYLGHHIIFRQKKC